jgi:hypothetical protein
MVDLSTLGQQLADFQRNAKYVGQRLAITGAEIDGALVLTTSNLPAGKIWVRLKDTRETVAVWAKNVSRVNVDVMLDITEAGELYVADLDYEAATAALGEGAATAFLPRISGSLAGFVVEGYQFKPGRARQNSTAGLLVYVEPFFYQHAGASVYFAGGTVDLTGTLPTTDEFWRWVKIGIDPDTNSLISANGTPQHQAVDLTPAQLAAITLTDALPLAGVKVRKDQTVIPQYEGDIVDCRHHFDSVGSGGGGGGATPEFIHLRETSITINEGDPLTRDLSAAAEVQDTGMYDSGVSTTEISQTTGVYRLYVKPSIASLSAGASLVIEIADSASNILMGAGYNATGTYLPLEEMVWMTSPSDYFLLRLWVFGTTGDQATFTYNLKIVRISELP